MARTTAQVNGVTLVLPERDAGPITVDTPEWFAWLEHATTFAFTGPAGRFTARKEQQARGGGYWKAYRTDHSTLHRSYLGRAQDLTLDRLNRAAATLAAAIASAAPPLAGLPPAAPSPPARPTAALARLYRAPFNGMNDCSEGAVLGHWDEGYAAGVYVWHTYGSEACGQPFGTCQPQRR
jgi:hypothetical protein